jgi:hypothetical protein
MSRKGAGNLLLLLLLILVLVLAYWLASTASEVRRQGKLLEAELEEAERETNPRPPLFGDPVPGQATSWYYGASGALPRVSYEQLLDAGSEIDAQLEKVYEILSRGARTEEAGTIWRFRRGIVRPGRGSNDFVLRAAMIREARRLAGLSRFDDAVDRLLVLVRYGQDLRRCGSLARSDWIVIETRKVFAELAPRLPSAEIERAHRVLRRGLEDDPGRSIERTQFLLARSSMHHTLANWGLTEWQGSRWGRLLWDRRPPWRPVRRSIYRTLELRHLPEALTEVNSTEEPRIERWLESENPAIRFVGAGLLNARFVDREQRRALEALIADLAARLRSS